VTLTFLFLAATLGGALNSVAGGGSFITLPALLYSGVAPVAANATSTMALWPGSVSSAFAYRRDITASRSRLLILGAVSLAGGLLGAALLVRTSDMFFLRLLPWLMLAAAVTFTFGGRRTAGPSSAQANSNGEHLHLVILVILQFAIATYGGYFGGGMGIMMLATLALAGMTDIHEMNGLKSILGVAINGIALSAFVLSGAVAWRPGLVMVGGGMLGGYAGAALARRLDRGLVRRFVVAVSWVMTIYFFVRQA
jgi:uncharacterized membrane protein YfcA